jgi:hypothetical protein
LNTAVRYKRSGAQHGSHGGGSAWQLQRAGDHKGKRRDSVMGGTRKIVIRLAYCGYGRTVQSFLFSFFYLFFLTLKVKRCFYSAQRYKIPAATRGVSSSKNNDESRMINLSIDNTHTHKNV